MSIATTLSSPRRWNSSRLRFVGALFIFLLLEFAINAATLGDIRKQILAVLGLAIGATLTLSRFGFAAAFRDAATKGDAAPFVAQMLMMALASLLIVPLLASGMIFGQELQGFATPIGISFVTGALLFGIGMPLSGGCASGTLFLLGGGDMKFLGTLGGFVIGSVAAAASISFWWGLPAFAPLTVFTLGFDWRLGLGLQIALCLAIAGVLLQRSLKPPPRLIWGGIALAILNLATVITIGRPWSETFGFALWGSKLAGLTGLDPQGWAYWYGSDALGRSIFSEGTSIMDFSIILGALLAATVSRRFIWRWPKAWREWAAALFAGMLMGYGARLSGGCNIGAYFSAIASGDFSGWIWALAALAGAPIGVALRQRLAPDRSARSVSNHDIF